MGILQLQNLNELKSIKFTIKILRMLIFHICKPWIQVERFIKTKA